MRKPPITHLFTAQFLLEDIREIYRRTKPMEELEGRDLKKFRKKLDSLQSIIEEMASGDVKKDYRGVNIAASIPVRTREEEFINIGAIQPGGRLTAEGRKALLSYGDGYSVCDHCRKPFRLDAITKPNIQDFYTELAEWLNMDAARVVPGARRGFQAVVSALVKRGDIVLLTTLSHYTEFLAVEQVGGVAAEVGANPDNIVTKEAIEGKIEEIREEHGTLPKLMIIDHFDYQYGNEHDVVGAGELSEDHGIPFLYNGAYSVGVMPVDGTAIGADFVVGSGHKSMASPAPTGVLAVNETWKDKVLKTTDIKGDVSGRTFGVKEIQLLGCTVMGAPLISMMASFPRVRERVGNWEEEVKKSNRFLDMFTEIPGNEVKSERPRKHTLSRVDTRGSFDKVAREHKKRGYFLSHELKERNIVGIFEGATRTFKLNTYGLSWDQIEHLGQSFRDIASKYGLM